MKGKIQMKIDWKRKLTSRKFWAAVVGFITPILAVFNLPDPTIEQIIGIVSATGILIAYIIGEGMVDAAYQEAPKPPDETNK